MEGTQLTLSTDQLLNLAANKLAVIKEANFHSPLDMESLPPVIESESGIRSSLMKRLENEEGRPNEASILLALIHEELTQEIGFDCDHEKTEKWPCSLSYDGEALQCQCFGSVVNISVLTDKENLEDNSNFYVTLSFSEKPRAYNYIIVKKWDIPTLLKTEESLMHDAVCVVTIGIAVQTKLFKFILDMHSAEKSKRFKGWEYSSNGIEPTFPASIDNLADNPPKKKKKKKMTPYKNQFRLNYSALSNKYKNEPDSTRLLVAILEVIRLSVINCRIAETITPLVASPITFTLLRPFSGKFVTKSFRFALFDNGVDFFTIFKIAGRSEDNILLKKISRTLVPKYDEKDFNEDRVKICNLTIWFGSICDKFLLPTLDGKKKANFHANFSSNEHSEQSSSNASSAPSRDE